MTTRLLPHVPDFVILFLLGIGLTLFWKVGNDLHMTALLLTWITCIWIRMIIIGVTISYPSPRYMRTEAKNHLTLLDTHTFDTGLSGHVIVGSCLSLYVSCLCFEGLAQWSATVVLTSVVNCSVLFSGGHWSQDVFLSNFLVLLMWQYVTSTIS